MALLEINLEKPALLEEYQYPGETPAESGEATGVESSGGGRGRLVAVLALVGVGLLAWRLRGRGTEQSDLGDFDEESETGPEPEIGGGESGSSRGRVAGLLGLAVVVAGLGAVARKRRD